MADVARYHLACLIPPLYDPQAGVLAMAPRPAPAACAQQPFSGPVVAAAQRVQVLSLAPQPSFHSSKLPRALLQSPRCVGDTVGTLPTAQRPITAFDIPHQHVGDRLRSTAGFLLMRQSTAASWPCVDAAYTLATGHSGAPRSSGCTSGAGGPAPGRSPMWSRDPPRPPVVKSRLRSHACPAIKHLLSQRKPLAGTPASDVPARLIQHKEIADRDRLRMRVEADGNRRADSADCFDRFAFAGKSDSTSW